ERFKRSRRCGEAAGRRRTTFPGRSPHWSLRSAIRPRVFSQSTGAVSPCSSQIGRASCRERVSTSVGSAASQEKRRRRLEETRPGLALLFFFQAEDGIRARNVTGVQTCALPI